MEEYDYDLMILDARRSKLPHETYTQMFVRKGVRGAVIRTYETALSGKIDRAVFSGEQGGPHMNSIAALVFHMHYYVGAVLKVLEGEPLNASDKYSFDLTPVLSQDDWEKLLNKTFDDAEKFAGLIEKLPEEKLWEDFSDNKYGNYYRNLQGIIEHIHYHLGQIVVIKKIIMQTNN